MTAGQFIKLDTLHDNFGAERVFQTARRLREIGFYNKGWAAVDAQIQAYFLFALFATNSPKYAIRAVNRSVEIFSGEQITESPNRGVIPFITELIARPELREKIDFILVSQKTGSVKVFFLKDKKKGHQVVEFSASSPTFNTDYDNENVDPQQTDSVTLVDMHFFDVLQFEIDKLEKSKGSEIKSDNE